MFLLCVLACASMVNDPIMNKEPLEMTLQLDKAPPDLPAESKLRDDPFWVKVVLTNKSKKTIELKYCSSPAVSLDFLIRRDGRAVSKSQHFGDAYSSPGLAPAEIKLKPGDSYELHLYLGEMLKDSPHTAGAYRIWGFFTYGEIDIFSQPLTIVVPKKK